MADLHDALTRLAADTSWPPTPGLAGSVRAAIEAAPSTPPVRRRSRRPLLAALLALAVGGGGVLAAPGVGFDLLERLGLRNANVTKVKRLPTSLGQQLKLGERTTLPAAQRPAGRRLLRPAALGTPRAVYRDEAGVVTFLYRARNGDPILFTQVPGRIGPFIQKFVTADTRRVRIAGRPGLLLQGAHGVVFETPDGSARVQDARLAKNTLLWERDGLLLRIEAEQPLGELLRIARSVP